VQKIRKQDLKQRSGFNDELEIEADEKNSKNNASQQRRVIVVFAESGCDLFHDNPKLRNERTNFHNTS